VENLAKIWASSVDVQHVNTELGSVVEDAVNLQTVRERLDVELGQQRGLRRANLVSLLDERNGVGDFDLTLDDLGGDLQDLEKRGLSWVASGGAWGNRDVHRSDGSHTCRGRHTIGQDEITDLWQIGVGEDEPNISRHLLLKRSVVMSWVVVQEFLQNLAHQGVLSHEDLSLAAHLLAGHVHLLRADIVHVHNEDLTVCVQHDSHASEVIDFLVLGERHLSLTGWELKLKNLKLI